MIAFTICANNYLAEALTLGDSLTGCGFDADKYLIFLVDRPVPDIDTINSKYHLIYLSADVVPAYESMVNRYTLIELSTAVKPSVFKYLISEYDKETLFTFLDPDLYFLANAQDAIVQELAESSVLLTPHITKPVAVGKEPFENVFLNYGIFNLGFIAVRANDNSLNLLNWWEERTVKLGVADVKNGFYVDQLWMTIAPTLFEDIKITKHTGFNVAYWNLPERKITQGEGDKYLVNGSNPLIFLHFSSFDISLAQLSKREHAKEDVTEVLRVQMQQYRHKLLNNNYNRYKGIKPYYKVTFDNYVEKVFPGTLSRRKIELINKLRWFIPKKLLNKIGNLNHINQLINEYYHQ